MKKLIMGAVVALIAASGFGAVKTPKHEFRGAWIHTVLQPQYKTKGTAELQKYLINQLDSLQAVGVNAVLFQVRPSADAFYPSNLEPWSRFLTHGGNAPEPYWDPLQFMIDEAHRRGMELHAWMNPYRVTTIKGEKLAPGHIYYQHPERFVTYTGDNKVYFDPGIPENREFIADVVADVVSRYDVDGVHFDDYFYPYPVKGHEFPDSASFAKYGNGKDLAAWRRANVDDLIEVIHAKMQAVKPWVRFGVSPFGIWRNKSTDPRGSDTHGFQCYDGQYADVLAWSQKGWIDYLLPQLYWALDHKTAPYTVLCPWWGDNAGPRHMYIGECVEWMMDRPDPAPSKEKTQLRTKIEMARSHPNIQGICWWPAVDVTKNKGGIADSLVNDLMAYKALPPTYPWISEETPAPVAAVAEVEDGWLTWQPVGEHRGTANDVVKYVVYRFEVNDEAPDFDDSAKIIDITPDTRFQAKTPGRYYVTAVNRVNTESLPSAPVIVK